jgi:diguanylate cyclase (GGDEF)-like protein
MSNDPTRSHRRHVDGVENADRTSADGAEAAGIDADPTSDALDRAADARDERATARDDRAVGRADEAERRDDRAEARERAVGRFDAEAVSGRAEAARHRRGAASDREHAAADRDAALSDRLASARQREVSSIDSLTGAYRRDSGVLELERETTRARRTGLPLVLAFIDVDGLKATNDSLGHAAGDQLLRYLVDTLRAHLRSYDLIVRLGGDEFVCGLVDVTIDQAAERFQVVSADLAERREASVSVGFAELTPGDSLQDLIARADDDLYRERKQRRASGA